jgi:hypothetical protein
MKLPTGGSHLSRKTGKCDDIDTIFCAKAALRAAAIALRMTDGETDFVTDDLRSGGFRPDAAAGKLSRRNGIFSNFGGGSV